MAIKRRRMTATTGTDGATTTFSKDLTLGAAYAKVLKVEIKGDDTNVDSSAGYTIVDAEGRLILTLAAFDAGPDDSAVKATNQVYSTVGRALWLSPLETDIVDAGGDFSANTEGNVLGVVAASPITVAQTGGTDGDVFQITAYVEV